MSDDTHSSEAFAVPAEGLMYRHPASGALIARNAVVTGDVSLGRDTNIWFHCVVRGDEAAIRIGARTNLQDGCIVHTDSGLPCEIGADCTIGHGAVIHGIEVGADCLVGIGAVILGRARIGAGSVIAAGAVVREGADIPPGSLVMGVPGKVVRPVGERERSRMRHSIATYLELANRYLPATERRPAGSYRRRP